MEKLIWENCVVVIKKCFGNIDVVNLDIKMNTSLSQFKVQFSNLLLQQRSHDLGIEDYICRVGYGKVVSNLIQNFTECMTDDQWSYALEKTTQRAEHSIVVIVNERYVCTKEETLQLRTINNQSDTCKRIRLAENGENADMMTIQNEECVLAGVSCYLPEETTLEPDYVFENETLLNLFEDTLTVIRDSDEVDNMQDPVCVETYVSDEDDCTAASNTNEMELENASNINLSADINTTQLSERFQSAVGNLWFTKAEKIVKTLQRIIEREFLPKHHILYLILHDVIFFVDALHSGNKEKMKGWRWNDLVKDFFSTVYRMGGKRIINFLRGPANFGKEYDSLSINDYNIPLPHYQTLRRSASGYTPRSGIYLPYLQSFIKVAEKASQSNIDYEEVKVILVCRGVDGFGLKAGCNRDQRINELIGATFVMDADWVRNHPNPDKEFLRNNLILEAEPEIVTTLDGRVAFPVGVNYLSSKNNHEKTVEKWKKNIEIIQICSNCLSDAETDYSTILKPNYPCCSLCKDCLILQELG